MRMMKGMIAAVFASVVAVGLGAIALGAETPVNGAVSREPALVLIEPHPSIQLARHDNDNGEGLPEGEYYGPPEHEGHKGHGEKHEKHHHEKHAGRHKEKHHREAEERERNYAGPFFRPSYARYFHDCYGGADVRSLPPGLQKHVERTGHLPPGLEKHLERDGTLPPGLEKRMSPANPCIMRHIGRLPVGSRLYLLGQDAYLINQHTRQIIDILRGAY